jgi:hypothetical protein
VTARWYVVMLAVVVGLLIASALLGPNGIDLDACTSVACYR